MALRPTVPRRPVSLMLGLLEKEKETPLPWSAGAGGRTQAVFCRPRTKNRLLASGGEKKKTHLRVKTYQECLAVTFPPLCRTDAVCQIVMPLCKDQRVFSGCWCGFSSWFILRVVSNSRLMSELE